jgi:hypothetical protein
VIAVHSEAGAVLIGEFEFLPEILRLEDEIHRWSGYLDFLEINIPHIRLEPKMWRYFL